jgi:hypothetical protein
MIGDVYIPEQDTPPLYLPEPRTDPSYNRQVCVICNHADTHHPITSTPWPPRISECESCPGGECRLPD